MDEQLFWSRLALLVEREFMGDDQFTPLRVWCDGVCEGVLDVDARPQRLRGTAWLGPDGQERWTYDLMLPEPVQRQEEIRWSQLLPSEHVTGWLTLDLENRHMVISPGTAVPDMDHEREKRLVETFVRSKRGRYLAFLDSAKGRAKFRKELYHFNDFDPVCMVALAGPTDSASGLLAELRRRGAGDQCYVVSVAAELDGLVQPLDETIVRIYGVVEGTIVCCVPGVLAYYEGEAPNNRFILHRR